MKKHLFKTAGFLLIFPMFAFAAYTDVSLGSGDTIINTAGINLTVSGTAASVDSITVGTDSFDVTMSGSAYIQVASSNRRTLTVSGATGSVTQSFSCTSAESTLTLSNPASGAQVTLTVTPGSSACTVGGGGGGSSGGGGGSSGGGSGSSAPATPATPAAPREGPATPATPSSNANPSARALSVSPAFNKTLKIGSMSADVKRLQIILNSDPDTKIADKGAGSPGKETTKFGAATRSALWKFQEKYGIAKKGDKGYGELGPATRAKILELFIKEGEKPKQEKRTTSKTQIKTNTKTTKTTKTKTTTKTKNSSSAQELQKQIKELQDMLKKLGS